MDNFNDDDFCFDDSHEFQDEEKLGKIHFHKNIATKIYNMADAIWWLDELHQYNGQFYEKVDSEYLISKYLLENDLKHTSNNIREIKLILKTLALKEKLSVPTYLEHPELNNLIPFRNGLLNIDTLELLPHDALFICTYCLPYDFKTGSYDNIRSFLNSIYENDIDKIKVLMEYLGYCFTSNNKFQKFLLLSGQPRSGKGTILQLIKYMVGVENYTGYTLSKIGDGFGTDVLVGKQVAGVGENNLKRYDNGLVELFKSIIGGDEIQICRKHRQDVCVTLPIKFIVCCNEIPAFFDTTGALSNRIINLSHEICFAGREDPDLLKKLLPEISGFAYDCILEYKNVLKNNKFSITAEMLEKLEEEREENSPTLKFIQEMLLVKAEHNPGQLTNLKYHTEESKCLILNSEMKDFYHCWLSNNGLEGNFKWLCRDLQSILPKLKRYKNNDIRGWCGIKWSDHAKKMALQNDLL